MLQSAAWTPNLHAYPQPLKVLFAYQLIAEMEMQYKHLCAELESAVPIYMYIEIEEVFVPVVIWL